MAVPQLPPTDPPARIQQYIGKASKISDTLYCSFVDEDKEIEYMDFYIKCGDRFTERNFDGIYTSRNIRGDIYSSAIRLVKVDMSGTDTMDFRPSLDYVNTKMQISEDLNDLVEDDIDSKEDLERLLENSPWSPFIGRVDK